MMTEKKHNITADVEEKKKKKKSSRFSFLPSAIRDLEAGLNFSRGIHKSPFILPCLALLVELFFPRLVKGLEPSHKLASSM